MISKKLQERLRNIKKSTNDNTITLQNLEQLLSSNKDYAAAFKSKYNDILEYCNSISLIIKSEPKKVKPKKTETNKDSSEETVSEEYDFDNEIVEDYDYNEIDIAYTDDSVKLYYREITQYPLLSDEQEKELLSLYIKTKDPIVKDTIIKSNLRLVVSIAKRYIGLSSLELLDLIQEGNIGLSTAIDKYDNTYDTKLSTYATYWIKQSIFRAMVNTGYEIRIPSYVKELLRYYKKVKSILYNEYGRDPSEEEIISYMKADKSNKMILSKDNINDMVRYADFQTSVSLDTPVGNEEDANLLDFIPSDDNSMENPERVVFLKNLAKAIDDVLNQFDEKERYIICARFGLHNTKRKSLEAIGKEYHTTKEKIRQIEAKMMRKLRHPKYNRDLYDYYKYL